MQAPSNRGIKWFICQCPAFRQFRKFVYGVKPDAVLWEV